MAMALEATKLNAIAGPNRVWNPTFTPGPRTEAHRVAAEAGLGAAEPDYETEVIVNNLGFWPRQVLFARAFCKELVDGYKLVRRLPRILGRPLELALDRFFLCPFLLYGLLTTAGETWARFQARANALAPRRLPWLSVRLRDRLTGNKMVYPVQ